MATLMFRLNRKDSSGEYNTIYYETSSKIVMRPNQMSAEEAFQLYDHLSGFSSKKTQFVNSEVVEEASGYRCITSFPIPNKIVQYLEINGKNFTKETIFAADGSTVTETLTGG